MGRAKPALLVPVRASHGLSGGRRQDPGRLLLVGGRLLPDSARTYLVSSKTDIVTIPALRCCRNQAHLHNAHSEILYVHCIPRKSLTRMKKRPDGNLFEGLELGPQSTHRWPDVTKLLGRGRLALGQPTEERL